MAGTVVHMSTNIYLDQREADLWLAYRRMNRVVQAAINADLMNDSGLSESDYDVLSNLSEDGNDRMRILDLGSRLRWSKSRISNHLTRMEKRGLVTRETCDTDGRGAFVQLTSEPGGTVIELEGRAVVCVVPMPSGGDTDDGPWTPTKHDRRCELVDKEMAGTLELSEAVELAQRNKAEGRRTALVQMERDNWQLI